MSFPEAFKAAKAEIARLSDPVDRARKLVSYARIFAAELLGTALAVPYGVRAFALHRSLPPPDARLPGRQGSASLLRGVRYGARPRNVLDIYLPPNASAPSLEAGPPAAPDAGADRAPAAVMRTATGLDAEGSDSEGNASGAGGTSGGGEGPAAATAAAPVVLFCHGGIWATGEGWHYAPLAARLAQAGVVTAVMQYTLYPQALMPEMVGEVSAALSWVLDHAAALGGDPSRVVLAGHSCGAQLASLALLRRALAGRASATSGHAGARAEPSDGAGRAEPAERPPAAAAAASGGTPVGQPARPLAEPAPLEEAFNDARMPCMLVGMAGAYDLAKHYEYEQRRGVHELSTMERAAGGARRFPAVSPAAVLSSALAAAQRQGLGEGSGAGGSAGDAADAQVSGRPFYQSFHLHGEAVAARVGFDRRPLRRRTASRAVPLAPAAPLGSAAAAGSAHELSEGWSAECRQVKAEQQEEGDPILGFSREDARRLPPHLLMSSFADVTVPWHESAEMFWALHDTGVPSKHLVYEAPGHGDFVTGWRALPEISSAPATSEADLPPFAADLVKVVAGRAPVEFCALPPPPVY